MSNGLCSDFATSLVCFTNAGGSSSTLVAHYEYAKSAAGPSILRSVRYTNADGTPVNTAGGTVSPGTCPLPSANSTSRIFSEGSNIANGTYVADYDPQGNGPNWTFAGSILQSLTVTALESGAPNSGSNVVVNFPSGGQLFLVEGQTVSWSVAQDNGNIAEFLDSGVSVDCTGNSAATVIWTEQV